VRSTKYRCWQGNLNSKVKVSGRTSKTRFQRASGLSVVSLGRILPHNLTKYFHFTPTTIIATTPETPTMMAAISPLDKEPLPEEEVVDPDEELFWETEGEDPMEVGLDGEVAVGRLGLFVELPPAECLLHLLRVSYRTPLHPDSSRDQLTRCCYNSSRGGSTCLYQLPKTHSEHSN
jgi:hypothetical protein